MCVHWNTHWLKECTHLSKALSNTPTCMQTHTISCCGIYAIRQMSIVYFFLAPGSLTPRKITRILSNCNRKKSAVFWQVHCNRQFSVRNTKRHLSLQLGRKERGGCKWVTEWVSERERKNREGEKDRGKMRERERAGCSVTAAVREFLFNPLHINTTCI